ncbi:TPA: glycosyltransferase family A protein [Streptococcus suis]
MKIKILTATYNNGHLLENLYSSLINQSDKDFDWIIIDDGSVDNTKKLVSNFLSDKIIKIKYYYQENKGKSSAINSGLNFINKTDFVVIVDADEQLKNTAIKTIKNYVERYHDNEVGIIHFNRMNRTDNTIIANKLFKNDLNFDYFEWKNNGFIADGYIGYFGRSINDKRFPTFEGEKYIGPSVLMMKVLLEYQMITAKEVIGITEYQDGGITKQGRKLRLKNPRGGIYYCLQLQNEKCSKIIQFKYSVLGYAYSYFGKIQLSDFYKQVNTKYHFNQLGKIPGFLLSLFWKKQYKL